MAQSQRHLAGQASAPPPHGSRLGPPSVPLAPQTVREEHSYSGALEEGRSAHAVAAGDVGVRVPSTTNAAGDVRVGGAQAPARWWNRGALPAEPIKR